MSDSDTLSMPTGLSLLSGGDVLHGLVGAGVTGPRPKSIDGASEAEKTQLAKDFESILIGKLFDQIQNTIGIWDQEQDVAGYQVHGIFWLHLAQDVANNGGFGLWKEIYQSLYSQESNVTAGQLLEGSI